MRIAIYGRNSTEKQEQEGTIESQLEALRSFAKKNNYTIYNEYLDEGYSGELLDRPALDRLRDDAKKKLFEAVLVHSPDRLSRKYIYLGILEEELKKSGVNFIFLNRPDAKDTPEDNLLNGVQGLIAEYEKAKILERTRRGKMHKARSNILVTSIAPYGYQYIKVNKATNIFGHYEVNLVEAKVVKLIFDMFLNKRLSVRGLIKELTHRGINPRQGKHWQQSSLHRILRNETYVGIAYYNKHMRIEPKNRDNSKYHRTKNTSLAIRPKELWIPITLPDTLKIIDKKTFNAAQEQLKRNSEIYPRESKYEYLLRGLIKCGECDSPFKGEPSHGKLFYRCGNRHRTFPLPRTCNARTVGADELDNIVWNKFCEAMKNPHLINEQIAKLKEKEDKNKSVRLRDIKVVEAELNNTTTEENRLLDAYREHIISMEQLKEQMAKIQEKRKTLEQEKQALNKQGSPTSVLSIRKAVNDYCRHIERRLEGLRDDFKGKSYLLHSAVNNIILDGKKVRIRGIIPANVGQLSTLSGCYESHMPQLL